MHEDFRLLAQRIWRQLATRNQWQLFSDENAVLDQLTECVTESPSDKIEATLRAHIQALYSERLYQGIVQREERAAYEIWLMFLRFAFRKGFAHTLADDLAQESMARVLAKIHQVKFPKQFLSWASKVFWTTLRDLRPKQQENSLTDSDENEANQPADPTDILAEVESRILEESLCRLLQEAVPNDLERLTLLRYVLYGDEPRVVARELGLPLHRTRVAKSRALQRLRENTTIMAWLKVFMTGNGNYG